MPSRRFVGVTMLQSKFFQIGNVLIALLLIVAAFLKLWVLVTDPFVDLKTGIPLVLLPFVIAWEFTLGVALIRISNHKLCQLMTIATFVVFGVVSVFRWAVGEASCGCLGVVEVPPWVSFTISILVVVFSAIQLRCLQKSQLQQSIEDGQAKRVFEVLGIATGFFVFAFVACLQMGSLHSSSSNSVFATVTLPSELVEGRKQTIDVSLTNRSKSKATIVGANTSCRCVLADKTYKPILPGKTSSCQLTIRPKKSGAFRQRVILYINHPDQTIVKLDLVGHVSSSLGEK